MFVIRNLPNDSRFTVWLLCFMSSFPTAVEPVKLIFFTIGLAQNSSPTLGVCSLFEILQAGKQKESG
jgi:hypothetical protein